MKTDAEVQKDVMEQLNSEPILDAAAIGVSVKNGVVTLSGQVPTFLQKLLTEKAAKKVMGVKAVVADLTVGLLPADRKTDAEIAEAAWTALKWHSAVKEEQVKIKVKDAVVTLEGEVEWAYQRQNAAAAIEHLKGVQSVINCIVVKRRASADNIRQRINNALIRSATIDSSRIQVDLSGNSVILTGLVRSFAEKEDAENAAWASPGISRVDNRLRIGEPELSFD